MIIISSSSSSRLYDFFLCLLLYCCYIVERIVNWFKLLLKILRLYNQWQVFNIFLGECQKCISQVLFMLTKSVDCIFLSNIQIGTIISASGGGPDVMDSPLLKQLNLERKCIGHLSMFSGVLSKYRKTTENNEKFVKKSENNIIPETSIRIIQSAIFYLYFFQI